MRESSSAVIIVLRAITIESSTVAEKEAKRTRKPRAVRAELVVCALHRHERRVLQRAQRARRAQQAQTKMRARLELTKGCGMVSGRHEVMIGPVQGCHLMVSVGQIVSLGS